MNWGLDNAKTGRVNPSGSTLLFSSRAPQLGYDNAGFTEFYLYDLSSDEFVCISCRPDGRPRPRTPQSTRPRRGRSRSAGCRPTSAATCPRTGRRRSSPAASRCAPTTRTASTTPTCGRTAPSSCCRPGRAGRCSSFVDASASGNDAFFLTRERLVGIDTDNSIDLYDGRVGGGLASQNPPPPPPPCQGEECKPPAPPQTDPPPGSTARSTTRVVPPPPDCSSLEAKAEKKAAKVDKLQKKVGKASGKQKKKLKKKLKQAKKRPRRPSRQPTSATRADRDDQDQRPSPQTRSTTEATMRKRPRARRADHRACCASRMAALFVARRRSPSADLLKYFTAEVRDQNGDPYTQAGGHPFEAFTDINFDTHEVPNVPRALRSRFPTRACARSTSTCPRAWSATPRTCPSAPTTSSPLAFGGGCPANTQVGVTVLKTGLGLNLTRPSTTWSRRRAQPAQFGFIALIPPVYINASVRNDGGLSVTIPNISQALPLTGTSLTFWGVPGDPAHDVDRGPCLTRPRPDGGSARSRARCGRSSPTRPRASGPVTTRLHATSWQNGAVENRNSTTPVGADGCDRGALRPIDRRAVAAVIGWTRRRGSRSTSTFPSPRTRTGSRVEPEDGRGHPARGHQRQPRGRRRPRRLHHRADRAQQHVRPAVPGVVQDRLRRDRQPAAARSAAGLDLCQATPNQNPFGDLIAIYIVAQGGGVTIKLAGQISPDPQTGQVTTTIDNAPQLPFSHFGLNFFGGPRAVLATPTTCGTKTASASLSPWSGEPADRAHRLLLDQLRPRRLAPAPRPTPPARSPRASIAGLVNPAAGSQSPFNLAVSRPDGSQEISTIDASLPEGVSAVLASVPACAEAQAAAGHLRRCLSGRQRLGQGRRRHQPVPDLRRLGLRRRPL